MSVNPREFLSIAQRAWTVPVERPRATRRRMAPRIAHALIIDTETTVDPSQRLLFGAFRYVRIDGATIRTVAEGLIYPDDLPETNPVGHALLREYGLTHKADVDLLYPSVEPEWALHCMSRSEFAHRFLYRAGYRRRGRREPALIVMFNAPFDWSRLAAGAGEARDDLYGGFSFIVWADGGGNEAPYRPRVAIKAIDSKRAVKKYRRVERQAWDTAGHMLDLRTLVFAITGQSHTLDSACAAFGVDGKASPPEFGVITVDAIEYCRRDVAATTELLEAVLAEYRNHPIDLQPTQAYSPASIAKSYLRAMSIKPRLTAQPDFPPEILGAAMSAFFGGRAEVHIRQTRLPIELVDVTSMYPTVDVLMNLWPLVTAEHVQVIESTQDVAELLDTITANTCMQRQHWPSFVGLAQIVPDGQVLPVRANYGPDADSASWSIGVNRFHDDVPHWYAIPDLIAAKILTGRAPVVRRAVRFVASGPQPGLAPVALRGHTRVDPRTVDFFREVVEQRQRLKMETAGHSKTCPCEPCRTHPFLKVLANSGSYGIYAEMVRHERPPGSRAAVTVYGPAGRPFTARANASETPGEFCFPPIAACITAAARLVLALIEHEVRALGGTWMFCDTDSFAIVATEHGGLLACAGGDERLPDGTQAVRALSDAEVEHVCRYINQLNPYDQAVVPDLLKREQAGSCYAISAKRYVITDENDRIVKRSLHGLGRLLDPRSPDEPRRDAIGNPIWVDEAWRWILAADADPDLSMPDWADLPAMSRITISSVNLWRPFKRYNRGRTWASQIKPFNFLLVPTIDPFGFPPGADADRFRLIAAYDSDARRWTRPIWHNLYDHTGRRYRVTTDRDAAALPDLVIVRSYRDILVDYRNHPEHKFDAPEGTRCRSGTRGQLRRRTVRSDGRHTLIGKEANRIDDVQAGIVATFGEVVTSFAESYEHWFRGYVLPVLDPMAGRSLADALSVDRRTIDRIRTGAHPRPDLMSRLVALAVAYARHDLAAIGAATVASDDAVLAMWRQVSGAAALVARTGHVNPASTQE